MARSLSTTQLMRCSLFVALITLGTWTKIPIPLVPFTLQFLFTSLAGLLLGPRAGFWAVVAYLALGLAGAPVFTEGGGLAYVARPTFGYLMGFALGAWVTGTVAHRGDWTFLRISWASFLGLVVVYGLGLAWYYFIGNAVLNLAIDPWKLFVYGVVMSAPGDIALCFLSGAVAVRARKMLGFAVLGVSQ